MKIAQTTVIAGLALAMLAVAAPNAAFAQSGTNTKPIKIAAADSAQSRHGKMRHRRHRRGMPFSCGPRAEKRGQRLTSLIDDLFDLNSNQQNAFNNLKSVMKDNRTEVKKVCDSLPKPKKADNADGHKKTRMNFLKRLEIREKMMTARLASLKKFRPAFTDFYNSLTEKQRRGLNRIMSRSHRHRR